MVGMTEREQTGPGWAFPSKFRSGRRLKTFVASSECRESNSRESVLECGGPPPLSNHSRFTQSARGLAHSKTLSRPLQCWPVLSSSQAAKDGLELGQAKITHAADTFLASAGKW
jgi:hypothetical protein